MFQFDALLAQASRLCEVESTGHKTPLLLQPTGLVTACSLMFCHSPRRTEVPRTRDSGNGPRTPLAAPCNRRASVCVPGPRPIPISKTSVFLQNFWYRMTAATLAVGKAPYRVLFRAPFRRCRAWRGMHILLSRPGRNFFARLVLNGYRSGMSIGTQRQTKDLPERRFPPTTHGFLQSERSMP